MRTLTTALVLAIASAVALAADIGDKAPPLSVQKWAFGVPAQPNAGDGKNICVVSFIDATSAEGRRVAGVLTKLQEKYRSQNVAVVAVMPAETDAAEYVTAQKPRFSIALDKQEATQSAYIPPMSELPYSFVVGKDGVILWSGRSLITLTRTVEQVAAGKYDLAQARPLAQLRKDLQKCLQEEDSLKTLAVLDKMMAIEPDNYQHVAAKVDVLRFREDIAAARKARSDSLAAMAGSADSLNRLSWDLVNEPEVPMRDPILAVKAATEAVKLTERKEAGPLDTLAHAYYLACLLDEAIAVEKEALAVAADDEEKKTTQDTLTYFESLVKAKAELQKK